MIFELVGILYLYLVCLLLMLNTVNSRPAEVQQLVARTSDTD